MVFCSLANFHCGSDVSDYRLLFFLTMEIETDEHMQLMWSFCLRPRLAEAACFPMTFIPRSQFPWLPFVN